jgi:uncharacterized protein YggE
VSGINFYVAHPEKYKEEARLKAVRAARDKAVAMAEQLDQKIGKPWEIIEDTDVEPQDLIRNVEFAKDKMPMQEEDTTVAGGEITIRALVRVSFQLE